MTIYLDHAATSPLRPQARDAYLRAAGMGGNASSVHKAGRAAKLMLEEARADILAAVGGHGAGLVFTSGGTEANALALHQASSFDQIIVSAAEHDSIFAAVSDAVIAPLTPSGQIDLAALESRLGNGGRAFVCAMLVNNETGVINDIAAAARLVHDHGGWLHVDAVQALGKMPIDFAALGADSLSLSAHKIGGGQGAGCLVYDRDRTLKARTLGGGQELGLRAGTENIPGIASFAAAITLMSPQDGTISPPQATLEARLRALGVVILGDGAPRAPGILCLAQPQWTSSLQLIHLDMTGICVSSGSACSSGKVRASRVVTAMGRPDLADKVLRVSSGWSTEPEDWQIFFDVWSNGYSAYLKRNTKEMA